jgi:rhodanese-related sulfurtransferase
MEIPRITTRQVAERLDRGERVVFVDARSGHALEQATQQIPGSIRIPPDGDVQRHAADLSRTAVVVAYCT